MYRKALDEYFALHRQEFTDDLCRLLKIESVKGEALPDMPYGPGPAAALDAAMSMARDYGFTVTDHDHRVVTVDMNDCPAQLDILAHLDVVPGGEGWTVTSPFAPVVKSDIIYGRGTSDDKGPAMAALYALRAVKELNIPLKKNVRLILGTDEECGSSDVAWYYAHNPEAPMTFSPDAEFPVINIEKGRIHGLLSACWQTSTLPCLRSLHCGERANVVSRTARATVAGFTAAEAADVASQVEQATGVAFTLQDTAAGLHVTAQGVSAHGSTPEKGNNPLTGLLTLLCRLPLADGSVPYLAALNRLFPHGDYYGAAAGIARKDDLAGPTTAALTVLHLENGALSGEFDVRTSLSATEENTDAVLRRALTDAGFAYQCSTTRPHHVPADSPLVQELLHCYKTYTGQKGETLAMGGATYVHDLKNGVAFGCIPPEVDTHMHGADEWMSLDTLFLSAKMFAQAIIDLCS